MLVSSPYPSQKALFFEVSFNNFDDRFFQGRMETVETKNKVSRAYHSAQIYKNKMIVVGNKGDDSTEVYKNEMKFLGRRRDDDPRPASLHILDLGKIFLIKIKADIK